MRKYVVGFILGVAFTVAFSASAAVPSLIGKQVDSEFPVFLDGVQLKNKAPAIEGTSYLPVREISETLGLTVDFVNNQVILESPKDEVITPVAQEQSTPTSTPTPTETPQSESSQITYDYAESQVIRLKAAIMATEAFIQHNPNSSKIDEFKAELETYKQQLQYWEQVLEGLSQ